jgi:hypothetical protein
VPLSKPLKTCALVHWPDQPVLFAPRPTPTISIQRAQRGGAATKVEQTTLTADYEHGAESLNHFCLYPRHLCNLWLKNLAREILAAYQTRIAFGTRFSLRHDK